MHKLCLICDSKLAYIFIPNSQFFFLGQNYVNTAGVLIFHFSFHIECERFELEEKVIFISY